jgi:hypothetical protein
MLTGKVVEGSQEQRRKCSSSRMIDAHRFQVYTTEPQANCPDHLADLRLYRENLQRNDAISNRQPLRLTTRLLGRSIH